VPEEGRAEGQAGGPRPADPALLFGKPRPRIKHNLLNGMASGKTKPLMQVVNVYLFSTSRPFKLYFFFGFTNPSLYILLRNSFVSLRRRHSSLKMEFFSASSEMFGVVFRDMKIDGLEFRGFQIEMSGGLGSGLGSKNSIC
jgi:hypothetical protein